MDETTTNAGIGNPVYIVMNTFGGGFSGTAAHDLDDFYVAAGTVASGGFRSAGTWTSATQTYGGLVATSVVLTYSGATAANYIDSVAIVDSVGAAIFTDGTDITSGTSQTILVPYVAELKVDWAVRVVLASGGAGTPTISQVEVTEGSPPITNTGGGGFGGYPVSLECTLELLQLHCSAILAPQIAGILIERTTWYADGKRIANGTGDGRIQRAILPATILPRGNVTIRVVTSFSNGQVLEKEFKVHVDNSWLVLLLLVGGLAAGIGILSIWVSRRRPRKRGSGSSRDYALWQKVFK